jgi:SCP-2 sterol transfer family
MRRAAHFFFMHIGSFVAVIVYFTLCERAQWSPEGVAHALLVALVVMTAYVTLAWTQGEVKQFDFGLLLLFAIGTIATRVGIEPVAALYRRYSPALLFTTLGLTALIPLLLGRETFVYYFARRQIPRWQLRLPEFAALSSVMTSWWVILFFTAAALCVAGPTDPRFTFVFPNLMIFGLGMTATFWLPPLYFRVRPPGLPDAVEPLVMGMPMVFDRKAAGDARASIQFCVSGDEPGDYHVRIAGGRCVSTEGRAPSADLTIYTPDAVWVRIAHGELDGGQALAEGLYRAEGDLAVLAKINEWFPTRR